MTIYGAIWYQGEANADAPNTYNCTFPAMIDDWRRKWYDGTGGCTDPLFPFGFVQVITGIAWFYCCVSVVVSAFHLLICLLVIISTY